jgi:hypothetical protein
VGSDAIEPGWTHDQEITVLKRLLLLAAMGLALAACNPATSSTAPDDGIGSPAATDSVPVDSGLESPSDMLEVSPSP